MKDISIHLPRGRRLTVGPAPDGRWHIEWIRSQWGDIIGIGPWCFWLERPMP